jgi:hypothetical protein
LDNRKSKGASLRGGWRRTVEEEAEMVGKTWREIKAIPGSTVC